MVKGGSLTLGFVTVHGVDRSGTASLHSAPFPLTGAQHTSSAMAAIRTHYQNLKVAEDAPDAVIRAAYRALTNEFHPDRNLGNPEAARIASIVNVSYAILSDPEKRREHDIWISSQRKGDAGVRDQDFALVPDSRAPIIVAPASTRSLSTRIGTAAATLPIGRSYVGVGASLTAVVIVALTIAAMNNKTINVATTTAYPTTAPVSGLAYGSANKLMPDTTVDVFAQTSDSGAPATPYTRPSKAPNGEPWPAYATYLRGYSVGARGGLSEITIDNSRGRSDVFVKLVDVGGSAPYPVRQLFIPAYGSITLHSLLAGRYDVRYRDLTTGVLTRSEPFVMKEISTPEGIRYSSRTLLLYRVTKGNLQTFALTEAEF